MAEREMMTVDETARFLGIGRDLAYRLARTHEIPSIRLGRRLVVPRRALEEWIEQRAMGHETSRARLASA